MSVRLAAITLVVIALVAGACGDDDDSVAQGSGDVTMTWVSPSRSSIPSGDAPYQGPVTLEGEAVDAGLVCSEAEGTEIDFSKLESDEDSITVRLDATITCADGSGDFVVRHDGTAATVEGVPEALAGPWTILSGTGDYEDLSGSGDATTDLVGGGKITKTYQGDLSRG